MKNKFDVDKIVAYLEPLRDRLPELYSWEISDDNLNKLKSLQVDWSEEEKGKIENLKGEKSYEKAIALKSLIASRYSRDGVTTKVHTELRKWIIKDWGGIKTGDDKTAKILIRQILDGFSSLKRISSTSKVVSFMNPEKYIIYDSRVAYSLNWIILSEKAGEIFFPMPKSRNSKLEAFDVNTLIRIKYVDKQEDLKDLNGRLYLQDSEAYSELNHLTKSIHEKLWTQEPEKIKKLYYTEMLLFSIADKEIYDDITSRPWSESSNQ